MSYRLSSLAESDLEDIWLYTVKTWSVDQADRYIRDIIGAIEALVSGVRQGRKVDIRLGYFKYAVGRHLVFFRSTDTGIEVVRILHQSMDVDRHL